MIYPVYSKAYLYSSSSLLSCFFCNMRGGYLRLYGCKVTGDWNCAENLCHAPFWPPVVPLTLLLFPFPTSISNSLVSFFHSSRHPVSASSSLILILVTIQFLPIIVNDLLNNRLRLVLSFRSISLACNSMHPNELNKSATQNPAIRYEERKNCCMLFLFESGFYNWKTSWMTMINSEERPDVSQNLEPQKQPKEAQEPWKAQLKN